MEADVKRNVENAHRKQKLYYNQKHVAGDLFNVGSIVVKDFRRKRQRGGTLMRRNEATEETGQRSQQKQPHLHQGTPK